MNITHVDAILLIYHFSITKVAPTSIQHVRSFERFSRFPVVSCNTEFGFDSQLRGLRFPVIVLHYSLFGSSTHMLNEAWQEYIATNTQSYKAAFFQDEYYFCQQRFAFINRHNIDVVFTLFDPKYWDDVYRRHTNVPRLVHTLTGYVSDESIELANRYARPESLRPVDIGYRARKLPFYMGRGAQEKWRIGREFLDRLQGHGLKLDISWQERDRIYGNRWYKFLGRCTATLGVESGVSITDLDGKIYQQYQQIMAEEPDMSFEEFSDRVLAEDEEKIPLRVISPRCFEAAAMRTCQIMFEGEYNGIMQPMVHYIPLKKDFSNFDEAIQLFRKAEVRRDLTQNAYGDLVESRRYSYQKFVENFDQHLIDAGCEVCSVNGAVTTTVQSLRKRHDWRRRRNVARYAAIVACVYAKRTIFLASPLLPRTLKDRMKKSAWVRRLLGIREQHDATLNS